MTGDRPFPMQEHPVTLPSGRVIVVLNQIVVSQRGVSGGSLGIQYRSQVSAVDRAEQLSEAREVAELHRAFAEAQGYTLSAQICNTPAAAETREPPERAFYFARSDAGEWQLQFTVGADGLREP